MKQPSFYGIMIKPKDLIDNPSIVQDWEDEQVLESTGYRASRMHLLVQAFKILMKERKKLEQSKNN